MILILQRLALSSYALATLLAFASVAFRRRFTMKLAPFCAAVGLLCHLLVFLGVGRSGMQLPMTSVSGVLSFLTMVAVVIYLYGYLRHGLHVMGIVMLPLALLLDLVSGTLPNTALPVADGLRDPVLWLHITFSTLGVGALFLTFTFSIIYLVQERALKGKRSAQFFFVLPSLTTCDRILYVSLMIGFVLLTLGLVVATIWSANFRGTYQVWQNQREILALVAWGIFALVLYARLVRGWRGRKTALLAIAGFAAVMLRLLGGPFL